MSSRLLKAASVGISVGRFILMGVLLFGAGEQATAVDYLVEIRPLLKGRCYACHGGLKQEAGLRLDTVAAMIQGGDSGAVIAPDDASASLLLERITATDPTERMPPEHEGEPFSADQAELVRRWIEAGAYAPHDEQPEDDPRTHWAFQTIVRPEVPGTDSSWVQNPVDAFLKHQHEQHGLTPQGEAARMILLRRLYIDLIGLPPTLDQIAEFQSDDSPDWYTRTAERLLNDPRHGERWARHWMDVWRYSDWWGLGQQLRFSQKHIWHYRDWIIESLNNDAPYDQMVRLMIAGDELYPTDLDKLRATGYLARNFMLFNRPQWMDSTVEHVGKGLLGLTFNCARCHDHKYDPIEHVDYYRLRAFFEPYHARLDVLPGESDLEKDGIPRVFDGLPDEPTYRYIRGDEKNPDKSEVVSPGVPKLLAFSDLHIQPIELPPEAWQPERQPWVLDAYRAAAVNKLAAANDQFVAAAELESVRRRAEAMEAAWSSANDKENSAKRFKAIEAERRLAVVKAEQAVKAAKDAFDQARKEQRAAAEKKLNLATESLKQATAARDAEIKLTDTFTPLIGAKWTPTRFKFSGKDDPKVEFIPTSTGRRTALANWITDPRNPLTARVAANHIWMRHMGQPLVPTVFDFGRNGRAPTHPQLLDWLASELIDNQWSMKHLHRIIVTSNAYRMKSTMADAEQNVENDPDNRFWWRRVPMRIESQVVRDSLLSLAGTLDETMGGPPVPPDQQTKSTRRSLYFFHSNNQRNQFLTTFDEAMVKECYRREQSVVPQQALALANSALALEASAKIAARLASEQDTAFIATAFAVMLGIEPNEAELTASQQALDGWATTKQRARANLIWALINHNDFVTVR